MALNPSSRAAREAASPHRAPVAAYPLLEALLHRRSRRFGAGMQLHGPLAYRSSSPPQPLSPDEEAALAFAACGVTGYALAELPYAGAPGQAAGGNIMVNFLGRTAASGHALHYVTVFVINDEGAWMLKRPQDYPRAEIPFSTTIGAGPVLRSLLRLAGRDLRVPTAVGLERGGEVLLKPFCPPYYRSMEEAVLAFVDYKYDQGAGTLRDGGAITGWQDGAAIQQSIPRYSDRAIAATIAYCEYVYRHYGRFPAGSGPFRTVLAHQAHHLDPEFYRRFYRPDVLTEAHRLHDREWHGQPRSRPGPP